jgi:dolichyl-phosphate beta-glucosyltransferase
MMLDADNAMPPQFIDRFLDLHEAGFPLAIGSRELASSVRVNESLYRHLGGRLINRLQNLIVPLGIKDTQCGYKSFTADAARRIFERTETTGFAFDVEALAWAKLFGLEVGQVPIDWYAHPESRVRPVRDALVFLDDCQIIKRRINNHVDVLNVPVLQDMPEMR